MSIISQIGVILLIIAIIFVLVRSNRQLMEAAEEGEHFVDEWAMRESRKQELTRQKQDNIIPFRREAGEERRAEGPVTGPAGPEISAEGPKTGSVTEKPEERITLVELDEGRRPIREIPVKRLPFTIGRAEDNDLVLNDLSIARKHCRIIKKKKALIMEDGGSRNKMAVGDSIQTEMILKDSLYIGIGTRNFLVKIGS